MKTPKQKMKGKLHKGTRRKRKIKEHETRKRTRRKKRKTRGEEINKDEMKKLIFLNSYSSFFSSPFFL
jgi:hypothetical protein